MDVQVLVIRDRIRHDPEDTSIFIAGLRRLQRLCPLISALPGFSFFSLGLPVQETFESAFDSPPEHLAGIPGRL